MNEHPGPLVVEMLPAMHGDAILLTWGPPTDRHRLLIDGGPAGAYGEVSARLAEVASEGGLDLLVLTHIDADHIEGTLLLTNDAQVAIDIDEVWFNGPAQLTDELGAAQGEMLAALVGARSIPWNAAFGQDAVCVPDDDGPLPVHCLAGGLRLTVLGPDTRSLLRLRDAWFSTCEDEGLVFASEEEALAALKARRNLNAEQTYLSDTEPLDVVDLAQRSTPKDTSVPNGSSIVLLAEYAGTRVLLPGDATPASLVTGIRRLLSERELGRLELAAFKLPHHGSTRNLTPELLSLVPADYYLFSSDGGRYGHPDDSGVAKCLVFGKPGAELVFNYCTPRTLQWDDEDLLAGFAVRYPDPGACGVTLSLTTSEPD